MQVAQFILIVRPSLKALTHSTIRNVFSISFTDLMMNFCRFHAFSTKRKRITVLNLQSAGFSIGGDILNAHKQT